MTDKRNNNLVYLLLYFICVIIAGIIPLSSNHSAAIALLSGASLVSACCLMKVCIDDVLVDDSSLQQSRSEILKKLHRYSLMMLVFSAGSIFVQLLLWGAGIYLREAENTECLKVLALRSVCFTSAYQVYHASSVEGNALINIAEKAEKSEREASPSDRDMELLNRTLYR